MGRTASNCDAEHVDSEVHTRSAVAEGAAISYCVFGSHNDSGEQERSVVAVGALDWNSVARHVLSVMQVRSEVMVGALTSNSATVHTRVSLHLRSDE